ncbi:MAG: CBS domain-containing protein [Bacteroidia bacterium]|jgi:signal-transduction protein with cAMP-binding, CBS, and nucleotidyltransferase domain|nr:CBS domain-containing protein [Bacteroidia bacterium]
MLVNEILSEWIIPLKKTDTCDAVAMFFADAQTLELPVVEQGKFIGYVGLQSALVNKSKRVEEIIEHQHITIHNDLHIFDAALFLSQSGRYCVAVCDEQGVYKGAITLKEINKAISTDAAWAIPGAIVTLEMPARDYTLTELSRLAEMNQVKITGVHIGRVQDSEQLLVSLKFNSTEINQVLHAFERYDYVIKSVHQISSINEDLSARMQWLIKYLNT